MIVKSSAVVLREIKYRDQSKICLLFTREYGKLSVMVKAGRNPKNRLNALLCTGNVIEAVIYRKSTRDIQLVSDAGLLFSPMALSPDLERFGVLYQILDLVRYATGTEEKNVPLFTLVKSVLERLFDSRKDFKLIHAWFLLRLVSILGFEPSISRCVFSNQDIGQAIRDNNLREVYFVHDPGGIALPAEAERHESQKLLIPVSVWMQLRAIEASGLSGPENSGTSQDDCALICDMISDYCAKHLERLPHRKHSDIVSQILSI